MLKARMTGRTKKKHAENRSNTAPPALPIIILGGEADEEGDSNDLHHQQHQHIQPQHTQPQHLRSLHESNFEENETEFLEETRLKQARRLLKQASKCLYASQERNPLSPFSSLLWGDIWKDLAETWTSWKKIDKCFQTAYTKYETTLATSGPAKVLYTTTTHYTLHITHYTLHTTHYTTTLLHYSTTHYAVNNNIHTQMLFLVWAETLKRHAGAAERAGYTDTAKELYEKYGTLSVP